MKKGTIQLNPYATKDNTIESFVCFGKFIEFLEEKVRTDDTSRGQFYQVVLDKIRAFPELKENMTAGKAEDYDEVLDLVAAVALPLLDDENEALMGLAVGMSPEIFYATNAFHQMMEPGAEQPSLQTGKDNEFLLERHKKVQADLILQKVYGYVLPAEKEIVHSFFNPVTGLYQYFRLNIDSRFVEVKLKPGKEAASPDAIRTCFESGEESAEMQKLLPVDDFVASGFAIISLMDITVQQAVDAIGKAIVYIDPEKRESNFLHLTRLLQTIVGSSDYQFGMLPLFTINQRAALPYDNFSISIVVKACAQAGISKKVFTGYLNDYLKNPEWIAYEPDSKIAPTTRKLPVLVQNALQAAGIYYYSLTPAYFDDKLVGILEVSAGKGIPSLNDQQAAKLKPAFPFLAQFMKIAIEKFSISIDVIIRDKFTNIQPSVQWKFNEVAWHYLRNHYVEHKNDELEKIFFKDVHPLYGAIDIRNSTIERNKALREDLEYQLGLLTELLTGLYEHGQDEKLPELAGLCRQWVDKIQSYVSIEEEMELNDFLYSQVQPLLISFVDLPVPLAQKMDEYYQGIDEGSGKAFDKRRQLEKSIQMINQVIGQHVDLLKAEVQELYPCYFEKFRTDGIEYDIYIGQSISPRITYLPEHLEKLRLAQIRSMAAMTRLTSSLLPQLQRELETTQLIFVNSRTIDISFRDDERRFDAEGAYNIRYHIVKKRIDKVHIRNTEERLTQPGKIAIVYFNEKDAELYSGYIQQLQQQQMLCDNLEYLELEELQGVAGLKALRVGVTQNANDSVN